MMDAATVRKVAGQVGLGALAIAAVTLVRYRLHLSLAIPAFLYLLVVVLEAHHGGFASSAIVSLLAVGCLDYFFTPPILQLEIASPIDGVALLTCLLTSLIITRLASEARQTARAAERKQEALERLYQVAWRLFSVEPRAITGAGTLQIFREVLDVRAVCLFDATTGKLEIAGEPGQSLAERTRTAHELGNNYQDRASQTWIQCLQVAGRRTGAIGYEGLSDAESMAAPLSMLAGAALERAQAFEAASAAAATSQVETLRTAIVDAFAHQFKTPLAAILTAAGGIRETRDLTPQGLEMVEMIEGETVRLSRLATRLLVTARLNRDEVQPKLEPTNLADLVARVVDQYLAGTHVVSTGLDGVPIEVASDQELLALALGQLLDNAFKYSSSNSAVQISLASKEGVASVRVRSRGTLIAPGERDRIFERFYRGAAAAGVVPGAGLGLYVARKIAHAHAGSLELEPCGADNAEATFCLRLPVIEAEIYHAGSAK